MLSKYELSCGYLQEKEKKGYRVTLWMEHDCYHVRTYNHKNGVRVAWDCADTFIDAKKLYKRHCLGIEQLTKQ